MGAGDGATGVASPVGAASPAGTTMPAPAWQVRLRSRMSLGLSSAAPGHGTRLISSIQGGYSPLLFWAAAGPARSGVCEAGSTRRLSLSLHLPALGPGAFTEGEGGQRDLIRTEDRISAGPPPFSSRRVPLFSSYCHLSPRRVGSPILPPLRRARSPPVRTACGQGFGLTSQSPGLRGKAGRGRDSGRGNSPGRGGAQECLFPAGFMVT